MKFIENADRDMAVMNIAHALTSDLRKCLLQHEFASFAVPGGTTPGPIFDAMSSVEIDWHRVHVMLTDERWVPDDHARSNAGLVKARLLTGKAAAARFVSYYRQGLRAQEAAPQLSQKLTGEVPISVLLLGMGADMHTASLFPGAPGLAEAMGRDAPLICAVSPPDQPEDRISLSAPALAGAMDKHLVIFGDDKRAALERAMTLPPQDAPIGAVIKGGVVHWAA
ncbi:6-phosphogluconolactonase [Roseobacter fucihabitans]|uniref:6-phosphogluconolactonase n=1 Tax=Roseobacter fucihabitans TaxID=1537242 RepID=A0ABZ2BTJ5_9RHOB|nr:6-phosphogluconolactonase [Roseobacter litoralis]MBC6966411.1 6-phosphogluconolactonase [Roseobacter litoralis]